MGYLCKILQAKWDVSLASRHLSGSLLSGIASRRIRSTNLSWIPLDTTKQTAVQISIRGCWQWTRGMAFAPVQPALEATIWENSFVQINVHLCFLYGDYKAPKLPAFRELCCSYSFANPEQPALQSEPLNFLAHASLVSPLDQAISHALLHRCITSFCLYSAPP
jgi:hypothetical protein